MRKSILKLPLEKRAEMAMREAVREALEEHARAGRSVYIWRDGKVVKVSARRLVAQQRRRKKR